MGLHPGSDVDGYAVAALADIAPGYVKWLVQNLVRAHLIEEMTNGRFHLHDVLRVYATELVAQQEDQTGRGAALGRLFDSVAGNGTAQHDRDRSGE